MTDTTGASFNVLLSWTEGWHALQRRIANAFLRTRRKSDVTVVGMTVVVVAVGGAIDAGD